MQRSFSNRVPVTFAFDHGFFEAKPAHFDSLPDTLLTEGLRVKVGKDIEVIYATLPAEVRFAAIGSSLSVLWNALRTIAGGVLQLHHQRETGIPDAAPARQQFAAFQRSSPSKNNGAPRLR